MIFQKNQILWVRCCTSFQAPQHIAVVISVSFPLFMMKNVNSMLSIFVCCLAIFFVSYTHQNVSGQIMYSIKGQSWNFDLAGQKISRNPRNLFKLTTSVILGHWTNGCYFAAIKRTSKMGLDILVLWWANHWEDKLDRSNRRQNCLQGY